MKNFKNSIRKETNIPAKEEAENGNLLRKTRTLKDYASLSQQCNGTYVIIIIKKISKIHGVKRAPLQSAQRL